MTGINACVIDIHPHAFPAEPMVVLIGFIGGLQIDAHQNSGQVIGDVQKVRPTERDRVEPGAPALEVERPPQIALQKVMWIDAIRPHPWIPARSELESPPLDKKSNAASFPDPGRVGRQPVRAELR